VQTTGLFTRNLAPPQVNFPQVLAQAFSAELIDEAVNSDVIEINDDHVIVIRVSEHEPQRTMALEEVSEAITAQLQGEKAQQAALDYADELLLLVQEGQDIATQLAERSLAWELSESIGRFDVSVGANVVEQAFTLGLSDTDNATTVAKNDGNVALVQLLKVDTPEQTEEQQLDSLRQRLSSQTSQANYESFIAALRAEANVVIPSVQD
jgi:peptidyl-prolyl cis-trans isomerase D